MGPNDIMESHERRTHYHMKFVYSQEIQKRQLFMQDLAKVRKETEKTQLKTLIKLIGPRWYQVLSVPQRKALDTLHFSIYQDILEGRPVRVAKIMVRLGMWPQPSISDLINAEYLWNNDGKEMLAQLFLILYGHPIDIRRASYSLNSRLILSSIFYLGLPDLIRNLKRRFEPDQDMTTTVEKVKSKKETLLISPYLQKMEAALYLPKRPKPYQVKPLPNLDDLKEPYDDYIPTIPSKPPLPPPPPPAPTKKLARSYCDKIAGYRTIQPHTSEIALPIKTKRSVLSRRSRNNKGNTELKRTGLGFEPPKKRHRKPKPPRAILDNEQYHINGVFVINGRYHFVLGNVSILPPQGETIHGGFAHVKDTYINIHCGIRGHQPPPAPDPCDCVEKYHHNIFSFLKGTKCFCGHHYDYGVEGTFPKDDVPFFVKPDRHTFSPFFFDLSAVYDTDPKTIHVAKEIKKIWDTEPMLQPEGKVIYEPPKKKIGANSGLSDNPVPKDYLRCVMRFFREKNVAARLPDVYEAPELVEWMRFRLYGPFTNQGKERMLRSSERYWAMLEHVSSKMLSRVVPRKEKKFSGHSTWNYKFGLAKEFAKVTDEFKLQLFRAQAKINNLMWRSMCHPEQPDKKFREIYFSYLCSRVEDLTMMHPYSSFEAIDRQITMAKRRYACPPVAEEDQPDHP